RRQRFEPRVRRGGTGAAMSAARTRGSWAMRFTRRPLVLIRPAAHRLGLGLAAASVVIASAGSARAQLDVNPPLPDIMLLVDTSGSMEFNLDGSKVTCDYADSETTGASQKSRWTQLVEVMTGDVLSYRCYSQDRTTTAFHD